MGLIPGFIGFNGLVKSRTVSLLVERPQCPFKGNRLYVTEECSPFFDIIDCRVGVLFELMPCISALPAEIFSKRKGKMVDFLSENEVDPASPIIEIPSDLVAEFKRMGQRVDLNVCPTGTDLLLGVFNRASYDIHFRSALIGEMQWIGGSHAAW